MSFNDRDYNKHNYSGNSGGMRISLPPITPVVKWLLIINLSIFVVSFLIKPLGIFLDDWFSVSTRSVPQSLQLWRVISYQFLHSTTEISHILMNMLMLYFFGPTLEAMWSSKKFIKFYLICGAMGGFVYPILYYIGFPGVSSGVLVGASGAIFGLIAATVALFPHGKIYLMGVFPLPMIVFAAMMVMVSMFGLLSGDNAGGEAAHLAGMAAGAIYVLWQPWVEKTREKRNNGRWKKKITQERDLYVSVDQILDKVHRSGMASLTRNEKQILKQATEKEQNG